MAALTDDTGETFENVPSPLSDVGNHDNYYARRLRIRLDGPDFTTLGTLPRQNTVAVEARRFREKRFYASSKRNQAVQRSLGNMLTFDGVSLAEIVLNMLAPSRRCRQRQTRQKQTKSFSLSLALKKNKKKKKKKKHQ
ncbi:unnamed protein product, partial [Protopolystoma xenopodis]